MKRTNAHLLQKLKAGSLPEPEPDMTGWTSMERITWHAERRPLSEIVREANAGTEPVLPEVLDAREAEDDAILAGRAAKQAAERLARDPASAALQHAAQAARETADKAAKAAEESKRIAEEAKLRPPSAPAQPAADSKAPAAMSAPPPATEPKPKPKQPRKRREPGQPKPEKQWWEERAQWRMRGPRDEDERRGRPLYRCIVDYDPIDYFYKEFNEEK